MTWVSRDLKVPDDETWVALVEINPAGETDIIGYVGRTELQQLANLGGKLYYLWNNYIKS